MIEHLLAFSGYWENGGAGDPMVKGGQVAYTTPGSYDWIVPEGVTEVSVVIISAGQQGRVQTVGAANPGAGGCLRWKNKIAVTPGDTYRIVVGNGGIQQLVPYGTANSHQLDYASSAFGIDVGITTAETTPVGADMGGGNGTQGQQGNSDGTMFLGGNSAFNFTTNGSATAAGRGVDLFGGSVNAVSPNGGKHGGGGHAQSRSSGSRLCGKGGDGAVKILWGNGRAFPSTNIADRV